VLQSQRETFDRKANKTHSFRERFFSKFCADIDMSLFMQVHYFKECRVCASMKALRNFIQRTSSQNCSYSNLNGQTVNNVQL
jgi:hypothetical protein